MQVVVKGLCDELSAAQQERDQLRKTNKQVQSKLETISKAHAGAERVCGVAWHISHPLVMGLPVLAHAQQTLCASYERFKGQLRPKMQI